MHKLQPKLRRKSATLRGRDFLLNKTKRIRKCETKCKRASQKNTIGKREERKDELKTKSALSFHLLRVKYFFSRLLALTSTRLISEHVH